MEHPSQPQQDDARGEYTALRERHWDALSAREGGWFSRGYHRRMEQVYRFLVSPGQRVIELGCGRGDLLAATKPAHGVGVDFSGGMIEQARQRHPDLNFVQADVTNLDLPDKFDVVILSDLIGELWDVQAVLRNVTRLCHRHTRVIVNFFSRLWQLPLAAARRLGLASPSLEGNWLAPEDVINLLSLADLEVIRHWTEYLWALPIPGVSGFCNRILARFWPFRQACLANFIVARLSPCLLPAANPPKVSVVVPARNEAGNIGPIIQRTPEMGSGTEIIFVEGHSRDRTYEAIEAAIKNSPHRSCQLHRQSGKGKADAVRLGFANATGDVLMILDADMTVAPEDLPRFVDAIVSHKGEYINGVRLVYPMQKRAMRFCNLLGNKFFSLAFSWTLGQPIKDTLCGTKVLWREDYQRLVANRSYFGDFDPFGDFDLIFGAAKLNLKMVDMPIRYRERVYGETNISRWHHGLILLKMLLFGIKGLKFT